MPNCVDGYGACRYTINKGYHIHGRGCPLKYVGKATDKPFKLLVLILYSEGSLDYVKRYKGNYFIVHNRPILSRFGLSARQLYGHWNSLARMGYIFNLSFEAGAAKFNVRYPSYLRGID